jgi:hypothetical protein
VLKETSGFGHPALHDGFAQGPWGAVLKWEKESEATALEHFMTHNKDGKQIRSRELARTEMHKRQRYKETICNYIHREDMPRTARDVRWLHEETKQMDLEIAEEACSQRKGCRCCFKKSVPNFRIGTEAAIENFLEHATEGCLVDCCQLGR